MARARAGNDIASCFQTSSDSHHSTIRGGLDWGFIQASLLLAVLVVAATGCDPITGTGSGTAPDPSSYLKVDAQTRTAVLTLIAGYPASDYQFNYNGYTDGQLLVKIPVGWQVTVQCANRSTINSSCAVVAGARATEPADPAWSTPDPGQGLKPGESASFVFAPLSTGDYRIASLVPGSEASGMWLDLEVVSGGKPTASLQG